MLRDLWDANELEGHSYTGKGIYKPVGGASKKTACTQPQPKKSLYQLFLGLLLVLRSLQQGLLGFFSFLTLPGQFFSLTLGTLPFLLKF